MHHTLSSVPECGGRGCAAPVGPHKAHTCLPPLFPCNSLHSERISPSPFLTAFHISRCMCLYRSQLRDLKVMETLCCYRRVSSSCLLAELCCLSPPISVIHLFVQSPLTNSILDSQMKALDGVLGCCSISNVRCHRRLPPLCPLELCSYRSCLYIFSFLIIHSPPKNSIMYDTRRRGLGEAIGSCMPEIWSPQPLITYSNVTIPLALDTIILLEVVSAFSLVALLDYSGMKTDFRMDIVFSCAFYLCVVSATLLILLHNSLAWICLEVDSPLPLSIAGLGYILSREEHPLATFACVSSINSAISRILIPCCTSQSCGFLPLKTFKPVSQSSDAKEITFGSILTDYHLSPYNVFLPLVVLTCILQVSPLTQFKSELLGEVKLCLCCVVLLVRINLDVIVNSVYFKVLYECEYKRLCVVARRSKEVACQYMSFGTQSEELVTLMWLWRYGVVVVSSFKTCWVS